MRKILFLDTLRSIRRTFSRYISIMVIVALGVGFFVGLKAVSPDMKAAAETFYQKHNLADIVVYSTVGFDDIDQKAILTVPGIESVTLRRSVDGVLYLPKGQGGTIAQAVTGTAYVMRIFGYDFSQMAGQVGTEHSGLLELVDGRVPERPDECVVTVHANRSVKSKNSYAYLLGQRIRVRGDHENLLDTVKSEFYTVVGLVHSPDFISVELGSSQAGGGDLSGYIYVPDDAFLTDFYTTMHLNIAHQGIAYSATYLDAVRATKEKVEDAGKIIAEKRVDRLQGAFLPQINEGKAKYEAGKLEFEKQKKAVEEGPARIEREKRDAEAKIAQKERELERGRERYLKNLEEYEKNAQKYEEALKEIEKYPNARAEYENGKNKLGQAEASFEFINTAVKAEKSAIRVAKSALESGDAKRIENAMGILTAYFPIPEDALTVEGMKVHVAEAEEKIAEQEVELEEARQDIEEARQKIKDAEKLIGQLGEFEKSEKALQDAKKQLDAASVEISDGPRKIEEAKKILERELEKGQNELEQGRVKLAEAETELSNAERQIRRAENQLEAFPNAQWIVGDRDEFPGYTNFGDTSDNMKAFALIFPVLFFLIAALVSLTTMTRMVDEERTQLGTLKATGYSSSSISFKYLFYAFSAGLFGAIFGTILGLTFLPLAIFEAYKLLYLIPTMRPLFVEHAATVALGFGAALLSTMGAVVFSVARALQHRPAELLRPKAPKTGKRVLLERLPFIWKKMSFNGKVTVRNLMRNKKRMMMTFVGIMGCTALLLTGFGFGNSIGTMLDRQFGPGAVMTFDGQGLLQAEVRAGDSAVTRVFEQPGRIADYMPVFMKKMYASTPTFGRQLQVTLAVPENVEHLESFVNLIYENSGKPVKMKDDGAYINGKTAEVLGLRVGDFITIQMGTQQIELPVAGITRNYVYHYVYVTPELFARAFGLQEATFNLVLLKLEARLTSPTGEKEKISAKEELSQLSRDLTDTAEVITVVYNESVINAVGSMIQALRNVIVAVFTVASGALAFVVLYNLNIINIYERVRELATIKVLGFFDKEADMFIYRENIVLTLFGILAGLFLGIPIHGFVIRKAEIESMMFVRSLALENFLWAAAVTFVFALLINLMMHRKIKAISMVESLKSVE